MKDVYKKKKGCHRDNPTFINLKSNTMKNTLQIYVFILYVTQHGLKRSVLLTLFKPS